MSGAKERQCSLPRFLVFHIPTSFLQGQAPKNLPLPVGTHWKGLWSQCVKPGLNFSLIQSNYKVSLIHSFTHAHNANRNLIISTLLPNMRELGGGFRSYWQRCSPMLLMGLHGKWHSRWLQLHRQVWFLYKIICYKLNNVTYKTGFWTGT